MYEIIFLNACLSFAKIYIKERNSVETDKKVTYTSSTVRVFF